MEILAIKGQEYDNKVIEIFEMLGGRNTNEYNGYSESLYYYIDEDGSIECDKDEEIPFPCIYFTLEEFIEKYPYKVGDKVNYVKYNDEYSGVYTIQGMRWTGLTIEYLLDSSGFSALTKDLQPYKEKTMEDKPNLLQQLKDYFDNTPKDIIEKEWHEYDKYNEIGPSVEEYMEYVNNIRRSKYPRTYEECCDVLKIPNDERYIDIDVPLDYNKLLSTFTKLRICRDAYWKLADEQMGLGKPWEFENPSRHYVFTIENFGGKIQKNAVTARMLNRILVLPTEEMQEAFLENFKDLIEKCRELL